MEVIKVKEHTNNTVSKANELIKAKGGLSGTAQKMLASIISMIRVDDSELQQYALKIDDYLKLINSKTNNDEFVKERAKELMRNPFEVDGLIFNWCSMVDIKSLAGYLVFDIHPRLKPYLLELKERGNFTQYKIVNILSLKGEYSPRLYEIFVMKWNIYKKHNPNAKSFSFELKILELRKMLNIPKSYLYGNIKQQILEVAKKQFKEKTDIQFTYKEQKIGRRVDRIIVTVKDNNKGSNDYLKDLKSFISFYRKNKVNEILFQDEKLCLSISEQGRLYDKTKTVEYSKDKSNILWQKLYKQAKGEQVKIELLEQEPDQPALFDNKPSIDEQLQALKGQKIYVEDKLFFFQDIKQKEGKYHIIAKDPEKRKVSIPTIHITAEATIDKVKNEMMEG